MTKRELIDILESLIGGDDVPVKIVVQHDGYKVSIVHIDKVVVDMTIDFLAGTDERFIHLRGWEQ